MAFKDLNQVFNDLLFKYHLAHYYPQMVQRLAAERLIRQLVNRYKAKKIAILATDQYDLRHFRCVSGKDRDVDFYFCAERTWENVSDISLTYNLSSLKQVDWSLYDKVIIISKKGELFLGQWLRMKHIPYIYLYDYFAQNGLVLTRSYHAVAVDTSCAIYGRQLNNKIESSEEDNLILEICSLRQKLGCARNNDYKSFLLHKLYFLSLYIRDFLLAERVLHWLRESHAVNENEEKAWQEIQTLLQKVKRILHERNQRDVMVFWLDQVPYDDFSDMPFIQSEAGKGVTFHNLFTVNGNTHPTMRALLCGKLPVTDDSYQIKEINERNSPVLMDLRRHGYRFRTVSGYWKLFSHPYMSTNACSKMESASQIIWYMICDILQDDSPAFIMGQILGETHDPYFSASMTDRDMLSPARRYESGRIYVDQQLRFYHDFFADSTVKIYMSDHGKQEFKIRFHVFMSIVGCWPAQAVRSLCSYVDFAKIVKMILDGRSFAEQKIKRPYVRMEDLDLYNGQLVGMIIKKKLPLSIEHFGYKGIITDRYIYIHFNTGHEWLAKRGDAQMEPGIVPMLDDICDPAQLPYFRNKISTEEKSISGFDKYSRYLQLIYRRGYGRFLKRIAWINSEIRNCPPKSIAVRMGGQNAYELYCYLTKENRERIACFIDRDDQCRCSRLRGQNVPPIIAHIEEMPQSVTTVLLSSFSHLKMLRQEQYPSGIHLLDLYASLEAKGEAITSGLATFRPLPSDYEVDFPFDEVNL